MSFGRYRPILKKPMAFCYRTTQFPAKSITYQTSSTIRRLREKLRPWESCGQRAFI